MLSQLLLAIGLPLALLITATFLTMKTKDGLPDFLQRLSSKEAMAWNIMIGFGLAVSLAYLMTRK